MASNSGGIGFLVLVGLAALAYANGGCDLSTASTADGDAGDGTFDFTPDDGDAGDADGLDTCDGVLTIESGSGPTQVPGDTGLLGTSASTACEMSTGEGDDDAVSVLQNALVECHGQAIPVDGDYGPRTAEAVAAVQRDSGVAADGTYGPVTLEVMQWPATSASADCVGDVSQMAVADESSELPQTG